MKYEKVDLIWSWDSGERNGGRVKIQGDPD